MATILRLVHAEQPDHTLRLRNIYNKHCQYRLRRKAEKTRQAYLEAIDWWERLTEDPPASAVTSEMIWDFRDALAETPTQRGRPRSAATVNKIMRHFRSIIRVIEPKDMHNKRGLGLVDYLDYPEPLGEERKLPRIASPEELSAIYAHCDLATWPKTPRISPGSLWRTALVLAYSIGPRSYDLLRFEWSKFAPDDFEGRGSITYTAKKTGKLQRVPLPRVARVHLDAIRTRRQFVWPQATYANKSSVIRNWNRIRKAAGSDLRLGELRKTCNTVLQRIVPGVGDFVLGHSLKGVNARYYYEPTQDVLKALDAMPMPRAFVEGADAIVNGRQKFLF